MTYKFNNYTFMHGGKQHLASGEATYQLVDRMEDEAEALFDDVTLFEVISPFGFVRKEHIPDYKDSVCISLNRNESLCRSLVL